MSDNIGQPDSVCHQWSIGVMPTFSSYQSNVATSHLSPAKNWVLKWDKLYFLMNSPSGSSFLIALIAVGAVNITETLYSERILQVVPASGVIIGFPSKIIEVFLLMSGP